MATADAMLAEVVAKLGNSAQTQVMNTKNLKPLSFCQIHTYNTFRQVLSADNVAEVSRFLVLKKSLLKTR